MSSAFLKFFAEIRKKTHFRRSSCGLLDSVILLMLFAYTGNQKKQRRTKRRNCHDPDHAKGKDPAFAPHPAGHRTRAYHPELEEELKECLFCLHRNEMMFDLEVDTDLIEQHIYERQALLARYRYLLGKARELGLHTILEKYQPVG